MQRIILIALTSLLFSACLREETPVAPYDRGDATLDAVKLQAEYSQQIWYDLGTASIVKTSPKISWDLAFSCGDTGHAVWLNTSLAMMAAPTGETDFATVGSTAGFSLIPDHPTGIWDSLALRQLAQGEVYLIERGFKPDGKQLGKRKIQWVGEGRDYYEIRYGELSDVTGKVIRIEKDSRYNRVAFSFTSEEMVELEPPKDQYDLVFTQYTEVFYDPYLPYLVTGVLLNPHQTRVARITDLPFEGVSLADAEEDHFSSLRNAIGYNWKSYNYQTSTFIVHDTVNYLIQDAEGFYYKLHFTDFYDDQGQKGTPTFEFQKL
ncbi:MAG: HmuY family protein [Bacteroidota bacterium]